MRNSSQVGAATETELKDKKLRYEDALNSVKSAIEMGVVPGGGSTLLYMIKKRDMVMKLFKDDDEKAGADIVFRCVGTMSYFSHPRRELHAMEVLTSPLCVDAGRFRRP